MQKHENTVAPVLQKGKSITSPGDKLLKISLKDVYERIYESDEDLKSQINSLRTIKTIDETKYRRQKTKLPYITCGIFNPPFRKKDNFASISCFIIDLDHISDYDKNIVQLKMKLVEDKRIMLLFESPGGDGIKILFALKEKMYDRNKYSLFYKLFILKFTAEYNLQGITDTRTSDVTRACFLSFDKEAYYNSEALSVDAESFIDFNSPKQVRNAELFVAEAESKEPAKEKEVHELPVDIFAEIKEKLNPKLKKRKEKQIFVPEKLNTVMEDIEKNLKEHKIVLKEIQDINYGKKIKVEHKQYWAEINIFFGQRGFSVVKSPKKGTNPELRDLTHDIICNFLF